MPPTSFQIRVCESCGLRYPILADHAFGTRCPSCLGSTSEVASYPLRTESLPPFHEPSIRLEALLDNIRSAWNVGAMFRTADGFGLSHLYLCGITPTPEADALKKTSLSAESTVGWTYHKNALDTAKELKRQGRKLLALEESDRAIRIQNASPGEDKTILIVGNEVTGVDPELLGICDEVLYIPMRGTKKSFNVAVAFAVAVSQLVL